MLFLLVHAWDYRKKLIAFIPGYLSEAKDWDFTTEKIHQNFSNYSAWHRRVVLLEKQLASKTASQDMLGLLSKGK